MDDPGPTYLEAAQRGDLTAHVVGALWWDRDRGDEQVESLVERRESYTHGRFRATSVKVMQDGVAENGTAALTAPYLDRCGHGTDNSGHSFVDPLALRRYVARLDAEGFQVHVHAHRRPRRCARRSTPSSGTRPGATGTTSPTSSWCTPTTYAASASSAWPPTSRRCGPASTTR